MTRLIYYVLLLLFISGCNKTKSKTTMAKEIKIMFLHQSTGKNIWRGDVSRVSYKIFKKGLVQKWFSKYNKQSGYNYKIEEMYFPNFKGGYKGKNYPFDYYNIWIKHAGNNNYLNEPTLETLTKAYDVIIWKHCYPVCHILPDTGQGDIDSEEKRIENYKLQYYALKEKMKSFPDKKFIVWTGAVITKEYMSAEEAQRAKSFFQWVKEEWDEPGDNIYLWDFYELETEGGIFFRNEYATDFIDSHPSKSFSTQVAPLFCKRIVDVIENRGDISSITGN